MAVPRFGLKRDGILARRIDLRCDNCDPLTAALPHELTHVVLADRFLDQPLPRWADEGIAVMADTAEKRAGHDRDLRSAITSGTRIRLASLFKQENYPRGQVAAFYAQSSSVARLLVERDSEATFVKFIGRAMVAGYDMALQEVYGLSSVDELERLWMREVLDGIGDKTPAPLKSRSPVSRSLAGLIR